MLTHTPQKTNAISKTHEKPWILLLMVFAWLWPGVFSHGLWNPAEPSIYTAVESLLNNGYFWLPTVFSQPDFSVSPLYIGVAALFQKLLYPWAMSAYSASRFASVFFTALGLTCAGMAGYHFLGRHQGRSVVLILIGCIGLITMTHFLNGLSVVFAALSMCLYGFSLAQSRVIMASLLLGIGLSLLSTATGFLLPFAIILMSFCLLISPQWRSKRYYIVLIGMFVFAIPLMLIYPLALYRTNEIAFRIWLNYHFWGTFGGLNSFQTAYSLGYYLKNIIWFAFPAWPLAIWTLTHTKQRKERWYTLTIIWLIIALILLAIEPKQQQNYLIWLLPPLALLAADKLDGLRRGAAAFLNWFGIMAFGLLAIFLWLGFFSINYGWPAKLAERSLYFSPYYQPHIKIMPLVIAILFTPLWLWAITRKHIRGRQAVTNWAAGVTLIWALLLTLFLPWLDAAKSYAPVVRQMQKAMPSEWYERIHHKQSCININKNATTARIAWTQYSKLPLNINQPHCDYRLVEQPINSIAPAGWQIVWQGARPRNKQEGFALLHKKDNY